MADMLALLRALPISALEADHVAQIRGLVDDHSGRSNSIVLREPPAGQRVPYIEPLEALEILLRHGGLDREDARSMAYAATARMRADIADEHWITFFDFYERETPEGLPVPDFVAWLRGEYQRFDPPKVGPVPDNHEFAIRGSRDMQISCDVLDFIEETAGVAAATPMFEGPFNWNDPWSLETLPPLPPPEAMIEFVPGAPWTDYDDDITLWNRFLSWRELMRPKAQRLEKMLGEPVCYFGDLRSDCDDDDLHRFFVLHWCCTVAPETPFVRYLLKAGKATNVDELKAALIDPASYTHPFRMNNAFWRLESRSCSFDYQPPDRRRK